MGEVAAAHFTIPSDAAVRIGVRYIETTVTELEDPMLRDPAVGTRNYQEPGASRLKAEIVWDFNGVDEFYPIYNINNGVLIQNQPQLNAVNSALARYDRESNGSYVVNGMDVRYLKKDNGEQVFVINEGKAHVDGFEIELPHSLRVCFVIDPDIQTINSDPYTFQPDDKGVMNLILNESPANQVLNVDVTVQRTITMTHGSYTGAMDPIPDTAVLEIIQVKQGETIYVSGTDYRLRSGDVDWSLPGSEPSPGSSYQITYRCRTKVTPQDVTEDGFKLSGAVDGTLVLVDYKWMMPRYDLITIDAGGTVRRIKGLAHPWKPSIPKAPANQLALANIYQNWKNAPAVHNNAVHAISMGEIDKMRSIIYKLYDLIVLERLKNDANSREPAAKKGVFVDPFFDDDMRDQGIAQTAAIVGNELTLPINATIADISKESYLLPYVLEPVLEQILQTVDMKINPYQAFDAIPARVRIKPNIDRWTEVESSWSSNVTRRFSKDTGNNLAFMRQATRIFEIEGFAENEQPRILFDGIEVESTDILATDKKITGKFTVPANVPAGTKLVQFIGSQGSYGEATYTGRGIITTEERRRVASSRRYDPLAQTFTLNEGRYIGGIDIWFSNIGTVIVQIRDTSLGIPTQTILAEAMPETINAKTRITWNPVWLEAGHEYAIVLLTDDAEASVRVAELGKYDSTNGRWVTSQPYQVGVLLSSSNASTWTAHQDRDLTFRLLAARFTENRRIVDIGTINANNVSDFIVLANIERVASDTDIQFIIVEQDGKEHRISENLSIAMRKRITGNLSVKAFLSGTTLRSPLLYPGVQIALGNISETADYITRAIPAGTNSKITITYEALITGTAEVKVYVQDNIVDLASGKPIDDNWVERIHILPSFNEIEARVKLVLTGNTPYRPKVRSLRIVIT